jgi:Uma2 family endonuclease
MGETTIHFEARVSASEVLKRYYTNQGKKVFIASDLHTLYPGERAFYPDLLLVFDTDDHHRRSWNVMREKKGLDFVLEILSRSTRRDDKVEKLNLFAKLGIPEYFIFDPENFKLKGYQLNTETNSSYQVYEPSVYEEIPADTNNHIFPLCWVCISL